MLKQVDVAAGDSMPSGNAPGGAADTPAQDPAKKLQNAEVRPRTDDRDVYDGYIMYRLSKLSFATPCMLDVPIACFLPLAPGAGRPYSPLSAPLLFTPPPASQFPRPPLPFNTSRHTSTRRRISTSTRCKRNSRLLSTSSSRRCRSVLASHDLVLPQLGGCRRRGAAGLSLRAQDWSARSCLFLLPLTLLISF